MIKPATERNLTTKPLAEVGLAVKSARKGFTLIELLVVIGIIAILAGIMIASFGTSTESARAAKCLSNLRSLAAAVNSRGMKGGWYPHAGSFQTVELEGTHAISSERVGWISWLSNKGDPFGHVSGNHPRNPQHIDICPLYGAGSEEDTLFAITNGTIFRAVGGNRDVYVCPEHRIYRDRKHLKTYWSYAMNAKFGYDYSKGTRNVAGSIRYGSLKRADRVLLFAEIPTTNEDGDEWASDCTLQYKYDKWGRSWNGTPEVIGFNHKQGKRGKVAHVVFADGHTEKLVYPKTEGGISMEALTTYLCEGKDIAFDGSGYKRIDEDTDD